VGTTLIFYHQLDAQTSCLFTYDTFIKILYMFRAYPAHLQEVHVVIVYMRCLVSSLPAGIKTKKNVGTGFINYFFLAFRLLNFLNLSTTCY